MCVPHKKFEGGHGRDGAVASNFPSVVVVAVLRPSRLRRPGVAELVVTGYRQKNDLVPGWPSMIVGIFFARIVLVVLAAFVAVVVAAAATASARCPIKI